MANFVPLGPLHMPLMQAVVRSCAKLTVTNTDYNNRILGEATRQGRFSTRTSTGRPEFLHLAWPTVHLRLQLVYFITKTKRFFCGGGCRVAVSTGLLPVIAYSAERLFRISYRMVTWVIHAYPLGAPPRGDMRVSPKSPCDNKFIQMVEQ